MENQDCDVIYIRDFYAPPVTVDKIAHSLSLETKKLDLKRERNIITHSDYYTKPKSDYRLKYSKTARSNEKSLEASSKYMANRNERKTVKEKIQGDVEDYLSVSTLHGFKYAGNTEISGFERFFWIFAFGTAFVGAVYFINQIFDKFQTNPVIITIDPTPVTPRRIPFPAVTICSMNSVMRNESRKIIFNGTSYEQSFLEDLCDFSETGPNVYDDQTAKFDNYLKFIKKVQPPCSQSLAVCKWQDVEIDCESLFRQVVTDDGVCCTFNQLPISSILKDSKKFDIFKAKNATVEKVDWDLERGYTSPEIDVFPYRSLAPGVRMGLTVVLDSELRDYYCSSTNSAGFKVLLHTPMTIPQMQDYSLLITPGLNSRLLFTPIIYDAVPSLKSISVDKRQCYFSKEKYLKNYKIYSENNCKLECLANATSRRCGCTPFHLHSSKSKTCSKMQDECVDKIQELMEMPNSEIGAKCDCLPACFNLEYHSTISYGKFTRTFKVRNEFLKNISEEHFTKNMAVLHVFFTVNEFQKFTKNELFGFSDFLSSTGGLLGLFIGFSSLSVVELLYHFSLRLFCIFLHNEKHKIKQSKVTVIKSQTHVVAIKK